MKTKIKLGVMVLTASMTVMANGINEDHRLISHDAGLAHINESNPVDHYPKMQVMLSIYKELIDQQVISIGEGVLSDIDPFEDYIIDEALLKEVYDWAKDNRFITNSDVDVITNDIKPDDYDYFGTQERVFWSCLGAVMGCGLDAVAANGLITGLSCVAAAAEAGANPWADAWCASQMAALGVAATGVCATELASACRGTPDTSGLNIGTVGGSGGKKRTGYCSGNGRVNRLDISSNGGIVNKVKGYCNDGSSFTVGTGSGGSTKTRKCNDIGLVSGVYGRSGSKLDSLGVKCDAVTYAGKYYSPQGTHGGSGGSSFDLKCPAAEGYLHGLEIHETRHAIKKNRRIISLAAICK